MVIEEKEFFKENITKLTLLGNNVPKVSRMLEFIQIFVRGKVSEFGSNGMFIDKI